MEVNSTFYRPMSQNTLKSWISRVKDSNFRFTLKAPQAITHEELLGDPRIAYNKLKDFEKSHIEPLLAANMFGALLIQLPPFFHGEQLSNLDILLAAVSTGRYPVFVEARNRDLYRNAEWSETIRENGASPVSLDSPEIHLEENPPQGGKAYIRLHGRNTSAWWNKGAGRNEKYDYEYNEAELTGFRNIIAKKGSSGDEIFVYFNNHPSGKAPRNASRMLHLLGLRNERGTQSTLL